MEKQSQQYAVIRLSQNQRTKVSAMAGFCSISTGGAIKNCVGGADGYSF